MLTYAEIDLDYEQFPVADLWLDLHWIQLPRAVYLEKQRAQREAEERESAAALPENHKVILVPADPDYSPIEEELWPLINAAVQENLLPHPELRSTIHAAIRRTIAAHRGWRNPFPANLHSPKPTAKK